MNYKKIIEDHPIKFYKTSGYLKHTDAQTYLRQILVIGLGHEFFKKASRINFLGLGFKTWLLVFSLYFMMGDPEALEKDDLPKVTMNIGIIVSETQPIP